MNIANEKIVPPFQPELIKGALQFMQRVQLSGLEAPTFVAACDLLMAIAEGRYTVTGVAAPAAGRARDVEE